MRYMAVASFSRGSKDTPKLEALLPVQEVLDEYGAQVQLKSTADQLGMVHSLNIDSSGTSGAWRAQK